MSWRDRERRVDGGVLSDGAIEDEIDAGRLIVGGFDVNSIRPASYDVTAADDQLIDPQEREIEPGGQRQQKRVILQPGDAAMFSTRESFCLPTTVAGNITIKNRLATEGLMLLSGGFIDPGYGQERGPDGQPGGRLYLHIANIGRGTVEIRPGTEPLARIQFLRVCGRELTTRRSIETSRWINQKKPSLGFLSELKELKASSEGTRDLISYIVIGGIFVLLMTMLSVALAVILSLSSEGKISAAAKAAVPQSASGKWLEGALVFALSILALGAIVLVWRIKGGKERVKPRS
jgi:deoxycytidine triphosphate deaminase